MPLVLLLAIAVGYLLGGRLGAVGELHLRRRLLVLLAAAAQAAGALTGGSAWAVGLAVSAAAVVGFLLSNRGVMGTGLVALGLAANALVIGLNGEMPVEADASARARISTQSLLPGVDARHELATHDTRLRWLGDDIPVLVPRWPQVVSPGDLLVLAGLAELLVAGMTGGRARPRVSGRLWQAGRRRRSPAGP
ncbi:MAG: hypothetical protein JWN31_1094 [Frankiales bacterium]|nr:hypothetical protein [Frankiales bacterium]